MDHGVDSGQFCSLFGDVPESEMTARRPYTQGLLHVMRECKNLESIDIEGILDFDCFHYCLDHEVVVYAYAKGIDLELGEQRRS